MSLSSSPATARAPAHRAPSIAGVFRGPRARSTLALLLVLLLAPRCVGDGFREDELECERAAVHVADCCPGTRNLEIGCKYIDSGEGCASSDVAPFLGADQSRCLQSASCAALVSGGVCAALAPRGAHESGAGGAAGAPSRPASDDGETVEPPKRKALREDFVQRTVCP